MIEFLDEGIREILPLAPRKGIYYRAYRGGKRLYFSDNEIARVVPKFGYATVVLFNGASYDVQAATPDHTEYEMPVRQSLENDLYYRRS